MCTQGGAALVVQETTPDNAVEARPVCPTPLRPRGGGGLAWVGERGRELVNLPRGSTVTPNHELAGMGGSTVQVIPSPYFNVVVDGRIQGAAPSIAAAGSQGAQVAMARRSTRRLA